MSCGVMASFLECADALCNLPSRARVAPEAPPESCVALALTLASYRALEVNPTDLVAERSYRESRALVLQLSTPTTPSFVFRDPFQNSDLLVLIQCRTGAEIESFLSALSAALMRKLKIIAANYSWDSEKKMLFFKRESSVDGWLWVPILNQRTTFVARAHLLGHFGQISTLLRLQQAFKVYWPSIQEDVAHFISTCAACITRLPTGPVHHPAVALPIPGIFHRVAMDLTLGLPVTARGNVGILVVMEYLTKFPILYAIRSKTADEIASKFLNFVCMFGPPNEILTDQGGEFVNAVLISLCANLGIEKRVTSSYSPATNGMVERFNRSLIRALVTLAAGHPENWDLLLEYAALSYRTRVHSATGATPFELMFGRPANTFQSGCPILGADTSVQESLLLRSEEIRQQVEFTIPKTVKSLQDYQIQQMATQDKAAPVRKAPLPKGSVVYCVNLLHQRKMQARFLGPYLIFEVTAQGLYKLENRHGLILKKAFPLDQLKIIDPEFAEEIWKSELTQVFTVDAIIDHRSKANGKGLQYLVAWRGYDSDHNSWVDEVDILDHDLISVYESSPPKPLPPSGSPDV